VRLRGSGRTDVAAYGIADAENQVEKELLRLWPAARVRVLEVRRPGGAERIAEEFTVHYRVEGHIAVEATDSGHARREAFRQARARFIGSRYWKIGWDAVEIEWIGEQDQE
jgi:hypothetical protein